VTATLAFVLATVSSAYRLVDSTGEPVRGATVRVVGSSAVTARSSGARGCRTPAPGSFGCSFSRASKRIAASRDVTSPAAAATDLSRETLEAEHPVLLADAVEEVPGASGQIAVESA
jgi:hypothetical protein